MSVLPLNGISFGWRSHVGAWHWLGLLYRRPAQVQARWRAMPRLAAIRSGAMLLLHALPWLVLLRVMLFVLLGDQRLAEPGTSEPLFIKFLWLLSIDLAGGIASGIAVTRTYYLPWHALLVWPQPRGERYPWHPVAWDDMCGVAFPGLERLLVAYAAYDRKAAGAEIERLIDTYPSQQRPALLARITLLAQEMSRQTDLTALDEIAGRLPLGPDKALAEMPRLREAIIEIAQQQRVLNTASHGFLREPLARALLRDIQRFRDESAGLPRPIRGAFRSGVMAATGLGAVGPSAVGAAEGARTTGVSHRQSDRSRN